MQSTESTTLKNTKESKLIEKEKNVVIKVGPSKGIKATGSKVKQVVSEWSAEEEQERIAQEIEVCV